MLHTSCPHHFSESHPGESEEDFSTRMAGDLEEMILREDPDTIAAFFGEPVMGAGGVIVPPKTYWEKIQTVLKKYDILLVADEVICGFGRTGAMFGSQTYGIEPDILIMSKQITSSYFPLSAFMINQRVFEPIADESGHIGVLGHGFTGGAHPVGAAVALENIKIIEERDLVRNAAQTGAYMQKRLREFAEHPLVAEVRGVGLIAAVELAAGDTPGQRGVAMNALLEENGIISRNMGDAMAFCPPMIISEDQVDLIVSRFGEALTALEAAETNGVPS